MMQLSGPWAIDRFHLQSLRTSGRRAMADTDESRSVRVANGIAVVPLVGILTKYDHPFLDSTPMEFVRAGIKAAADKPGIAGILLLIDSPGGQIAGTQTLADEIARAAKIKPVAAHVDDLATGSAYWIASQASYVGVNTTGLVGGIGIAAITYDYSAAFQIAGIKTIVARSGPHKGAGTLGDKITDLQAAHKQDLVNVLGQHFMDAVTRGRKLTGKQADALKDGKSHIGQSALAMGLVDAVQTADLTLSWLRSEIAKRKAA